MMKEQLEAIRKGALEAIAGTKAAAELDALRVTAEIRTWQLCGNTER